MTYRPCCPQTTFPQQRTHALSPSGFHAESRTWAGYSSYWDGDSWSGSLDVGIDIDTGELAYNLAFVGIGSSSPSTVDPIARDHAGTHYFLYQRSQLSQNPTQEATIFDIPDVIGGHHTGVYTFELVTVPASGWSTMTASTELVHDEGLVYFSNTPGSSFTTWNDFEVTGLDWSPFEDCLYAILAHRDSDHEPASQLNYPNDGYDHVAAVMELWRIQFDGSYDVVWTLSTPNGFNQSGPVTVSSDGSVWFVTTTSPDSEGGTYTQQVWRLADGDVAEVVPEGGPYSLSYETIGSTPWGDVLLSHNIGTYPSLQQGLLMVSPDGSSIPFSCPQITGSKFISGMMRQEDFMKSYVFARNSYLSETQVLYEIDWKRCGAGWKVGGM